MKEARFSISQSADIRHERFFYSGHGGASRVPPPASSNQAVLWPPYTLRLIKCSDLPVPGFVRHQLPTMCWREETPAPEQKIYSSITIHPDVNILPLLLHGASCIIPLTENKCIIRGSSTCSFKVSAHFYNLLVCAPTPPSPTALTRKPPFSCSFPSAHLNAASGTAGLTSKWQRGGKTALSSC